MSRFSLQQLPPAMQKKALELYVEQTKGRATLTATPDASPAKRRLRQKQGPSLNKTEEALYAYLQRWLPSWEVKPHGIVLTLANGCVYKPDFFLFNNDGGEPSEELKPKVFEAKGPHAWDDAIVKLKVAAGTFTCFDFYLATPTDRTKLTWQIERVLP